jgi:hypothetical protein
MNPVHGDNFETLREDVEIPQRSILRRQGFHAGFLWPIPCGWGRTAFDGRGAQPEDDVASSLMIHLIANLRKCLDDLSSRDDGKLRH